MACKNPEKALLELAKYFTSGNHVPVDSATIRAKDFWEITGLNPENYITYSNPIWDSRFRKVRTIFHELTGNLITSPDTLFTEYSTIFDSLDFVEFVMVIEEEFNISLPDEKVENVKAVKDLVDLISETINGGF